MTHEIEIVKHFSASVDKVYDAWTKPELFSQWMGPGSVKCKKIESNLIRGGEYKIYMETEAGMKVAFGVYEEIIPNEKLSFTWAWEDGNYRDSLVVLSFKREGEGTELALRHTRLPDEPSAQHHKLGWEGSLEKLSAFL